MCLEECLVLRKGPLLDANVGSPVLCKMFPNYFRCPQGWLPWVVNKASLLLREVSISFLPNNSSLQWKFILVHTGHRAETCKSHHSTAAATNLQKNHVHQCPYQRGYLSTSDTLVQIPALASLWSLGTAITTATSATCLLLGKLAYLIFSICKMYCISSEKSLVLNELKGKKRKKNLCPAMQIKLLPGSPHWSTRHGKIPATIVARAQAGTSVLLTCNSLIYHHMENSFPPSKIS